MDFLDIRERTKQGIIEILAEFKLVRSSDLMIRGNDFYAVWNEEKQSWTTDEQTAIDLMDNALDKYVEENKERLATKPFKILYIRDTENKRINRWREYCTKQARNWSHDLDAKLVFANDPISKRDYSSHRLPYAIEEHETPFYEKLINTLYSETERHKIEWAIGAVIAGASVDLQKFLVFYGAPGTGKSTVLHIIEHLFDGYWEPFDAKRVTGHGDFALEQFRSNPLVCIQHDGDLSKIEDNSKLNSLVSHEAQVVNEKHKSTYRMTFRGMLFMGTNKPVKITDSKSGVLRRLIDVSPTGGKLSPDEYNKCQKAIYKNELGGIANHCLQVYQADPHYYDDYRPLVMMGSTNDFFNFVEENVFVFQKEEYTLLKEAYLMYCKYAENANIERKMPKTPFKEELKTYFNEYYERKVLPDGTRASNIYIGFKHELFEIPEVRRKPKEPTDKAKSSWLEFNCTESLMDIQFAECPAQVAVPAENGGDKPKTTWKNNTVKLKDIDTHELHYLKPPDPHFITIDFDIPDENGNKSFELNLAAASKWPPTYAELSKSGAGIHLEYYYEDDVTNLENVIEPHVEVKVFTGNSSLRRKLTKCNDIPIATLTEHLPEKKKKDNSMLNKTNMLNEQNLTDFISKAIETGIDEKGKVFVKNFNHAHAPNVQFINAKLNEAFESGIEYDVSKLMPSVLKFAQGSHHQAPLCVKMVSQMHWKSADKVANSILNEVLTDDKFLRPIAFYDVEVFKNLFVLCYQGLEDEDVTALINPTPEQVAAVVDMYRLVGFNNRRYDNHIMYARMHGYSELALYKLSKSIVQDGIGFFSEAYNLSYTDIYDYTSTKQSLKKWEIQLGIPHKECGIGWDEEVPEHLWTMVADYCKNDVRATKAVWFATTEDFLAREILADITGMTVNDTTNTLTGKLIFGDEKHPQTEYEYRNMAGEPTDKVHGVPGYDEYTAFNQDGKPIFPGYKFERGKSSYRDVDEVGEGGRVFARPGIHCNAALLDIASMHPSSIIAENLFGIYTKRFEELVQLRICIKHKDFEKAKTLLGGKCAKYLDDPAKAKKLAKALKIAINSVYGLTSAHFNNLFKDQRNIDNIVAKRGALFMINLQHEVEKRGFTVAHIKTDSIKIPDATPEIIQFVMDYGKMYGYTFEHEATYERMCLVNDAVYIAKFATAEDCIAQYGYAPEENQEEGGKWTATGAQFQHPYVFKTLFSHEPLTFSDYCETKSVQTALYLDFNESLPDVSAAEECYNLRTDNVTKPTKRQQMLLDAYANVSDEGLKDIIDSGHNYEFIGKVGSFVPVMDGNGGGMLVREQNGRYYSATGAKGWRWKESETANHDLAEIDQRYFDKLNESAISTINNVAATGCWFCGDFDWLVNGVYTRPDYNPDGSPNYPDELPFN